MLQAIRHFPKQFQSEWLQQQPFKIRRGRISSIYYFGMGGSALPADLINDYFNHSLTLNIIRDYRMPVKPTPRDLLIFASYSGNTEEVLEALRQTDRYPCQKVVLAHGGQLKERALLKKKSLVIIPDCVQPRCAAGYFFTALLSLLEKTGRIGAQKKKLEKLSHFLQARQSQHERAGRELATFLQGFVPIIYGPSELEGTCRFWKIKFNENSKIQSFYNVFPELNHNEMVGYTKLLMKPAIIYLKSHFMHPSIGSRMEVMQKILSDKIPFFSVQMEGADRMQEIFDSLAVADFASYYLAQDYGFDPAPVEMVEEFKKQLV